MTRLEALEAVAEAARVTAREIGATGTLFAALSALDALPAEPQPPGEMVTLAVFEDKEDGEWRLCRPNSAFASEWGKLSHWTRLGTVTLPLDRERGA